MKKKHDIFSEDYTFLALSLNAFMQKLARRISKDFLVSFNNCKNLNILGLLLLADGMRIFLIFSYKGHIRTNIEQTKKSNNWQSSFGFMAMPLYLNHSVFIASRLYPPTVPDVIENFQYNSTLCLNS